MLNACFDLGKDTCLEFLARKSVKLAKKLNLQVYLLRPRILRYSKYSRVLTRCIGHFGLILGSKIQTGKNQQTRALRKYVWLDSKGHN